MQEKVDTGEADCGYGIVQGSAIVSVATATLDGLFDGSLEVPFEPFDYQLEGIAFLMPRHSALLADEMGLGKTMQTILALRLQFHQGLIRSVLLVCPKPLVHNWCRELKMWAPDLPFEVFPQDTEGRRTTWQVSNCPLKIINYEALTRDVENDRQPENLLRRRRSR